MGAKGRGEGRWFFVGYASMALIALPVAFGFGYLAGGVSYGFYAVAAAAGCYVAGAAYYARR
jgi:hypothetical protein